MENKEIQEIKVEKELPKTLEEYVIKEIESYKKQNAFLVEELRTSKALNYKRNEELLELKNKYYELINRLKEDFKPEISKTIGNNETYFKFRHNFIYENNKEKDKYYIDLFKLKEGEEDNEIQ